jgi:hypothetical protein
VPEFGISPVELAEISQQWREGGRKTAELAWDAFGTAHGSGSEALAAIRDCGDPAAEATASVGDRLKTLADKVTRFAANTVELDQSMGAAINELPAR